MGAGEDLDAADRIGKIQCHATRRDHSMTVIPGPLYLARLIDALACSMAPSAARGCMVAKRLSWGPGTAPVIVLIMGIGTPAMVHAENWPQWRGPRGDGVSHERAIASHWSRSQNILWRLELPGPAGSTPVIWNDRIFLTTVDGSNLDLLCVSTGGSLLWKRTIGEGNRFVRGGEGNYASPSPSTDGHYVWSLVGTGDLACHDFAGRAVWQVDLADRYGPLELQFGYTSTPVLDGERLYLQLIHGDGDPGTCEAVVIALDKRTGEEVWKHRRKSDARMECEHSYASPILYRDNQRSFLVTHGADYTIAHRLEDGAEIWRCGGLNPKANYNLTLRLIASPVAAEGLIVAPSAKNGPVMAIRPDAQGDITGSARYLQWTRAANTPDVPSPLIYGGLVYLCRENGNLLCLEAGSGRQLYQRRTVADRHRASPLYADGKIYLTARRGVVTVVRAGRKFELLARNALDEPISASPAVANGTLYLRTFRALYAIRE